MHAYVEKIGEPGDEATFLRAWDYPVCMHPIHF